MTLARTSIDEVEHSPANVFLLWEYATGDAEALLRLRACLRTFCHYNTDRVIHVFSNTLRGELLSDVAMRSNEIRIVGWSPTELARHTPFEGYGVKFDPAGIGWIRFSDSFRSACVWRWGGSYTDTDNICIRRLPDEKNLLSRTYDPHSFDVKGHALIAGKHREGPDKARYDHIPFRLRYDPLLNFEPEHPFIGNLIRARQGPDFPYGRAWQAIATKLYADALEQESRDVRAALLLAYFPDGRGCYEYSDHDKCKHGGEICDILFRNCPDIEHVGNYETRRRRYAAAILEDVYRSFPYCSFLWSKTHYHFRKWRRNKISNWLVRLIFEEVGMRA